MVSDAFLKQLREMRNDEKFVKLVVDSFGERVFSDNAFISWLSRKLGFDYPIYFKRKIQTWKENNFMETRGTTTRPLEEHQTIFDDWIENSIPSVDMRNGRDNVKMKCNEYEKRYINIINDRHPMEVKKKRGKKVYVATRRVATCTVRRLQRKLEEKNNVNASLGLLMHFKPFFITSPTDKVHV